MMKKQKKKKYEVSYEGQASMIVEATSEKEAIEKVEDMNLDSIHCVNGADEVEED